MEVSISFLLSIGNGEEDIQAAAEDEDVVAFNRLRYCLLYLLEQAFQDH